MVVMIEFLAVEALNALVRIDMTFGMDGLYRTFVSTALARIAAFTIASQPIEHTHLGGNRQRSAQWAQIAAEETLDK